MKMTEREWQSKIVMLAKSCGWRVSHFRPARTADGGWRTAVQYDGAGFPDLVMVHATRGLIYFVELKSEDGRMSAAQWDWLQEIELAARDTDSQVRGMVWRPSDWPKVAEMLAGGKVTTS